MFRNEIYLGRYKPTDLGLTRLFGTFKRRGRSYDFLIIKKSKPWGFIDKEIAVVNEVTTPLLFKSMDDFNKCFYEITPKYLKYVGKVE